MFEVTVEHEFDAAHFLRGYNGKCERLHGHRYRVATTVRKKELDQNGMACDFTELKDRLSATLEDWDHRCLNELAPFDDLNPSAENIALTVYNKLIPFYRGITKLHEVTVWESPGSRVVYRPS
jgi:6-pyruvoyltetrahydropterin/6-carboxytetrahydropterin synthase